MHISPFHCIPCSRETKCGKVWFFSSKKCCPFLCHDGEGPRLRLYTAPHLPLVKNEPGWLFRNSLLVGRIRIVLPTPVSEWGGTWIRFCGRDFQCFIFPLVLIVLSLFPQELSLNGQQCLDTHWPRRDYIRNKWRRLAYASQVTL